MRELRPWLNAMIVDAHVPQRREDQFVTESRQPWPSDAPRSACMYSAVDRMEETFGKV